MTVKRQAHRLLSVLLAILLVVSALPLAMGAAAETEFVSENILRKEGAIDTDASKGSMYITPRNPAGTAADSTRLTSKNLLTTLTDGVFSYAEGAPDIIAFGNTDYRLFGALFALDQAYYSDHITVYGGTDSLIDYYRVYASDSLDTLFRNENLTIVEGNGAAAGAEVPLHKDVQYIAFVYDHLKVYQDTGREDASNGRPKEIELWSGDESRRFEPENLLTTDKLSEAKSVAIKSADGTVMDYTANAGKVTNVLNGKSDYSHTDMSAYNDGNIGFQFKFDSLYYIGEVVIDAGTYWAETTNYNEKYSVYAADTLEALYGDDSLVAADVACNNAAGARVTVDRYARYVAVINTDHPGGIRIRQIQVKTASDADVEKPFVSENALQTQLEKVEPISYYPSNGNIVYEAVITDEKLAAMTDGNTTNHVDLNATQSWTPARSIGAQFTLKQAAFIGHISLYAGYEAYPETYSIYASDSLDTLYTEKNRVAESATATEVSIVTADVNRTVQYIAFICDSYSGNPRFKEIEAWTAEAEDVFVPENVLQTQLKSSRPILMYSTTGTVVDSNRFNAANANAVTMATDGDTTTSAEVWGALDWGDPIRYVGIEYTLTDALYCGDAYIYAQTGEKWRVYAAENSADLYTADSLVGTVDATEGGTKLTLGRTVQYVAFVNEYYEGAIHIRELELFTAEPEDGFVPENALRTKLADAAGVNVFISNGQTESSSRFDVKGALAASTDGDRTTTTDVYGALDWDPARYVGAVYTLTDAVFADYIMIYSGSDTYQDTYRVYAADSLDTLYSSGNMVGDGIVCGDAGVKVEVKKPVRYVAFFCTAYDGVQRVREFELWTGDPNAQPEPDVPDSLKVLTIGNSFSENTSVYASEIARSNGKDLTFGYLKFPSCTIEMHYTAAVENRAVFKFDVTFPDGTHDTAAQKAAASSFDDVDGGGATVEYALNYCDWDVIVFQQESSSSRYASTFEKLGDLVAYVQAKAPNARLAIHEVWRWGDWDADQFALIQANTRAAAAQYQLEYIPTGTAFEYARTALGSDTIVNDNDGHHQHANAYGQYIAGSCYVASLFGISVSEDTFTSHPYVNDNGQVAVLTKAANDAVASRPVYGRAGDMNGDGYLDAADVAALQQALLSLTTYEKTVADANEDGTVDIRDLVFLSESIA